VDSMVVETNIHHPTDSALLGDGVRLISRLLRGAKKALPTEVAGRLGKEVFRTRNRSVRRVSQQLHGIARKKGEKAGEELKEAYRKLIDIAEASRARAVKVTDVLRKRADDLGAQRLLRHFEHFVPLVERSIEQAVRRVLKGEQVPATEKLLSLFEEHTQIITRHKAGKPHEFGRKVLIEEVDGGVISGYEVLQEASSERAHLPESLRAHRELIESASVGRPNFWQRIGDSTHKRTSGWPKSRGSNASCFQRAGNPPRNESNTRSRGGLCEVSGSERVSRGGSASSRAPSGWIAASITARKGWVGGLAGAA
jgi:hypothetical protein